MMRLPAPMCDRMPTTVSSISQRSRKHPSFTIESRTWQSVGCTVISTRSNTAKPTGLVSIARSARWADGIAGFSLGPDADEVRSTFAAVREAWTAAGRDTAPRLTTSSWYSLADDGAERLHRYASEYLSTFGPEAAKAMRSTILAFQQKPRMAVCLYHDRRHLWELPLQISRIQPEYRLHLRRYADECWELVGYALPSS